MSGVPISQLLKALETAPANTLIEHVHVTQFEKKNHLIEFICTVEPYSHRGAHYTIGKRYEEFEQLKSHCGSIATFKSKFPPLKSFGAASTKDLHARCHGLDLWLRECLDISASFPIIQRALFKFLEVHVNVDLGLGVGAAPAGAVPTAMRRASAASAERRRSQQHKTLDFSALALGAAGGDIEADMMSPTSGTSASAFAAASAPPPPPAGPSATRREIDAMYRQFNPAKLAEVDTLVGRYGEEKLLAMMKDKYLPPSAPPKPQVTMRAAGAAVMAAGAVQQVGGPGGGAPPVMSAGAVQQVGGPSVLNRRTSKGQVALAAGLTAFQGAYVPAPAQELPASAVAPQMMAAGAVQQIGGAGAGAPPTMAPAAVQQIGGAAESQELTITVPATARGGSTLKLRLSNGQEVQIKLPDNARPGQTVKIRVPTSAPAPVPAPAPAPAPRVMTPEMKLAAEMGVSVEQAARMLQEDAEAKARAAQRRASVHLQASAPQAVRPGMGGRSESMMLAQEIGVDRVTARHMLDENKQAADQIHADATIEEEVTIKVPAGAQPGQTLKVKVSSGLVVSVKVPAHAGPGSVLKLRVPAPKHHPAPAAPRTMAAGAVQQVGGPGAGAPRTMAAGAVQQIGGPGSAPPTMAVGAGAVQQLGGPGAGAPRTMAAGAVQQVGGPGAGAPRTMAAGAVQQVGGPGSAPPTMAVGAGAVQQLAPSPRPAPQPVKVKMQITVPQGVKPGAPLQIQLPDGRTARIQVPPGTRPGATLTIQV